MYLNNVIYSRLPDPLYVKPKDDYASYFQEMHQFTGGFLDLEMLIQKSGYAFSELFDRAIIENREILQLLQRTDMCVLINGSYEYDSRYSHIGSYIKDHYKLNADLFDITEQGGFGLVSALHLLRAFFSQQKILRGLIVRFVQRTLPLLVNQDQALPTYNGVVVMDFRNENIDYRLLPLFQR